MDLYDHPDCPYGMKVRIVLAEGGLDYDMKPVDLQQGQHRQAKFLKLNPFGKVPVLVDEDTIVYDSTIINEYLNDEYFPPDEALLPTDDSALKAKARMLEEYADLAFTLPAMAVEHELARPAEERDQQRLSNAQEVLKKGLTLLERELKDSEFLVGTFSLADVAFAPTVLKLDKLGIVVDSSMSAVKAWINRLAERPSIGTVVKLVA